MLKKFSTLRRQSLLLALLLFVLATAVRADGVPRAECFPIETLPAELRPKAEAFLLQMMDSEALYTMVGALKPMSSGYRSFRLNVTKPDTSALEEAHTILAALRCGDEVFASVLPLHRVYEDRRYFEAAVFNRRAIRTMLAAYPDYFAPYGFTAGTPPLSIALVIEHDPSTARFRGLGYLYGYPKHAVDFFVAGADEQGETDKPVPRDFIHLPTFERATGRFVYAVPKGHLENEADKTLRIKTERIFAAYKERRARYVGPGRPGIVTLLRDWFDDGTGLCSPDNARF